MTKTIKKSEDNDKEIIYKAYLYCKVLKSFPSFLNIYILIDVAIIFGSMDFYIFSVYLLGLLDKHAYISIILMLTGLFLSCCFLIVFLIKRLLNYQKTRLENALFIEGITTDDPFLGLKYWQGVKLTIDLEKQHLNSIAGINSLKDSFGEDFKIEKVKVQFFQFPISIFLTLGLYSLEHTSFGGNFPLAVIFVGLLIVVLLSINTGVTQILERIFKYDNLKNLLKLLDFLKMQEIKKNTNP